jgi:hypothetical protein
MVTPASVMTRRRPARIHDHGLSFLDQAIQAAGDVRVEGHRVGRARRQRQTSGGDRAAQYAAYQSAAINRAHGVSSSLSLRIATLPVPFFIEPARRASLRVKAGCDVRSHG